MKRSNASRMRIAAALCTVAVVFLATQLMAQIASLDPAKMPIIGTVDERFQSYNIEMVEVIGGIEPARSLILTALKSGKPVVTANKGARLPSAEVMTGPSARLEAKVRKVSVAGKNSPMAPKIAAKKTAWERLT